MKITEIFLETSKPEELKDFYSELLHCKVESSSPGSVTILTKNTRLIFHQAKSNDPVYHFAFTIPSNKIDEAFIWLKQRVELLWIPDYKSYIADFAAWNAKSVYFKDPAGNIVEFIARFDLNDNELVPFSQTQIRCVSEIGLVFPDADYDTGVADFLAEYSLSYFIKQPPLANFRAVGDDEGLFICVPDGRPWYPTNSNPAGGYPMKVNFEIEGRKYFLSM